MICVDVYFLNLFFILYYVTPLFVFILLFYFSQSAYHNFLYIFVLGSYIVLTLVYLSTFIFLVQSFYYII